MSKFTAPSWDVDGKANILCDNFSGGQKFPKKKRIRKKKHYANNDTAGKEIKGPNKNKEPGYGKHLTQKRGNVQFRVKTKNSNLGGQNGFKKVKGLKGNGSNVHFESSKEGRSKFGQKQFDRKQKLNNFRQSKKRDFDQSSDGPKQGSFSNQKNNRKKNHLPIPQNQKDLSFGSQKVDFKSAKGRTPKGEHYKNKRKNFETQNQSGDVPLHHGNSKAKNRKRNAAHLTEFQNNGPSVKRQKFNSDVSNHQFDTASQNKVEKGKQFPKHKKFTNEVVNNSNNNNSSSDNQNRELKSPYFGKNRFFDSSLSLRERMLLQLKSSRFRYINEQLYTSDSKDAEVMFKKDPDLFKVYHEGFKQQIEQWPVNPVEKIIKAIQKKPSSLVVADFGCGDAKLAKSVPNKVHSFDLVALSDEVTVCDMAHTPLESDCIDICVFCLSLMGTNLGSYLIEANRILKVRGTLKIAEVASRFTSVEQFIKDMKKYGFSLINKDLTHDLFYFLNFQKDLSIKKVKGLPDITLNPCWYKKR